MTLHEIEVLRAVVQLLPHDTVSLAKERVLKLFDLAEEALKARKGKTEIEPRMEHR